MTDDLVGWREFALIDSKSERDRNGETGEAPGDLTVLEPAVVWTDRFSHHAGMRG